MVVGREGGREGVVAWEEPHGPEWPLALGALASKLKLRWKELACMYFYQLWIGFGNDDIFTYLRVFQSVEFILKAISGQSGIRI